MFKTTIQELTKALKVNLPEPEANGEYHFTFDGSLKIAILPTSKKDALVITAPITDSLNNSPETENLLKKLLQTNFSRLKEYEEVLTWDPDSAQIILSKEIPFSQLSEKPLFGQLEKFINNLEFWKNTATPTLPS